MRKYLAVLSALFLLQGCSKNPCEDDVLAYVMAQSFVKQALKSPASAKFPTFNIQQGVGAIADSRLNDKEQDKNKCHFFAEGYVDSQNSFGATIRSHYEAQLMYDKSTQQWYKESLKFK